MKVINSNETVTLDKQYNIQYKSQRQWYPHSSYFKVKYTDSLKSNVKQCEDC